MKRNLTVLALLAAIALLSTAPTFARSDGGSADEGRQVTKEYTGPGIVDWSWPTGSGGGTIQANGIKVMPRAGESLLDASIDDSFHPKMGAYIRQSASDGHPRVFYGFCGATGRRVQIDSERPVWIYVSTTPCGQVPGTPVSGEVTLTFFSS